MRNLRELCTLVYIDDDRERILGLIIVGRKATSVSLGPIEYPSTSTNTSRARSPPRYTQLTMPSCMILARGLTESFESHQ